MLRVHNYCVVHIRKAEASDLPHVRDCLALAFEQYRADYTPAMFENTVHSALSAGQYLPALTLVSPDKSRSPHLALGLWTPRDAQRRLWAPRDLSAKKTCVGSLERSRRKTLAIARAPEDTGQRSKRTSLGAPSDLRVRYDDRTMMLMVFRSRLTAAAGSDYSAMSQAIKEHAERFPGFVDIKSFTADDGERLTLVHWQDAATLQAWADDAKHVAAKNLGRAKWYEYYDLEIAEIVRTSQFQRQAQTTA